MPAAQSETLQKREKADKIRYHFVVNPKKNPEIIEKLSSVRPVSRYVKTLIKKDIEAGPGEEPSVQETHLPGALEEEREIFRKNFARLLDTTKTTAEEFSERIHVNYMTVCSWRAGRSYPRAEYMQKICEFFHISRSEIHEEGFSSKYMEDQLHKHFSALSVEGKLQLLMAAEALKDMYPEERENS